MRVWTPGGNSMGVTIRMHEKSGLLTKSQADDAIKVFNG